MIISASYKTDIPAFYGEWLVNRFRAGYCKMVNPYGRQVYTVNLRPDAVDGIVFWTKNIGPLLKHLPDIRRDYAFVVQHTINGYPRELESRVIDYGRTVQYMHQIADTYGPRVAVWRYDPILLSDLTLVDWHKRNFAALAESLSGSTDEVVISFAQIYKKTKRNMQSAAKRHGFSWDQHEAFAYPADPDDQRALDLVRFMAQAAQAQGITLTVCAQERYLIPGLVSAAHCIETARLAEVAGREIDDTGQQGNRKECACAASRDIGEYDTCPHGCVYCYAVQNREMALSRYKRHDPSGEFLFTPEFSTIQVEPRPRAGTSKSKGGGVPASGVAPRRKSRTAHKESVKASAQLPLMSTDAPA